MNPDRTFFAAILGPMLADPENQKAIAADLAKAIRSLRIENVIVQYEGHVGSLYDPEGDRYDPDELGFAIVTQIAEWCEVTT